MSAFITDSCYFLGVGEQQKSFQISLTTTSQNFNQGQSLCEEIEDGNALSIAAGSINSIAIDFIDFFLDDVDSNQSFYIGLVQTSFFNETGNNEEPVYEWVDETNFDFGSSLGTDPWGVGQPSNESEVLDDCVVFAPEEPNSTDFVWKTADCSDSIQMLCLSPCAEEEKGFDILLILAGVPAILILGFLILLISHMNKRRVVIQDQFGYMSMVVEDDVPKSQKYIKILPETGRRGRKLSGVEMSSRFTEVPVAGSHRFTPDLATLRSEAEGARSMEGTYLRSQITQSGEISEYNSGSSFRDTKQFGMELTEEDI